MAQRIDRRRFLRDTALTAGGVWAAATPARAQSANEKLNIGIIGTANRATANIDGVESENIVAVCDIDEKYLAVAKERFPEAATYFDYRKLLERKDLDAVVISTPDHHHAPATAMALKAGLHVYCEKPLTRTVHEARLIAELAKKQGKATQMGTQIHAESNYRRVVEILQSGAIGPVTEVHTWVYKVHSGKPLEPSPGPAPAFLHWDEWLGPVEKLPYQPEWLPARWRGYWHFGNGTLGDMGCHHMDLAFWALGLTHPTTVRAEGPERSEITTPPWLTVTYQFAARDSQPPVTLTWYDGQRYPPILKKIGAPEWGGGNLFVGSKGMLLADYSNYKLFPEADFKDFVAPPRTIPDSIGHYNEWIQACKTGSPTTCNFGYAGMLTETVLLGNVAYRTGQTIEWDPKRLRATNCAEADRYLKARYRRGWKV